MQGCFIGRLIPTPILSIFLLDEFADRASRCFHFPFMTPTHFFFLVQITGVNVKVRSTDRSPTVMHIRMIAQSALLSLS